MTCGKLLLGDGYRRQHHDFCKRPRYSHKLKEKMNFTILSEAFLELNEDLDTELCFLGLC